MFLRIPHYHSKFLGVDSTTLCDNDVAKRRQPGGVVRPGVHYDFDFGS